MGWVIVELGWRVRQLELNMRLGGELEDELVDDIGVEADLADEWEGITAVLGVVGWGIVMRTIGWGRH